MYYSDTAAFCVVIHCSNLYCHPLNLISEMSLSSLEGYCTKLEKIINVDTANNFCLEDPAFCTVLYHVMFFMILISPKEVRLISVFPSILSIVLVCSLHLLFISIPHSNVIVSNNFLLICLVKRILCQISDQVSFSQWGQSQQSKSLTLVIPPNL